MGKKTIERMICDRCGEKGEYVAGGPVCGEDKDVLNGWRQIRIGDMPAVGPEPKPSNEPKILCDDCADVLEDLLETFWDPQGAKYQFEIVSRNDLGGGIVYGPDDDVEDIETSCDCDPESDADEED